MLIYLLLVLNVGPLIPFRINNSFLSHKHPVESVCMGCMFLFCVHVNQGVDPLPVLEELTGYLALARDAALIDGEDLVFVHAASFVNRFLTISEAARMRSLISSINSLSIFISMIASLSLCSITRGS